jgi:hypothetical protein
LFDESDKEKKVGCEKKKKRKNFRKEKSSLRVLKKKKQTGPLFRAPQRSTTA